MTDINQLSGLSDLSAGDLLVVFSTRNGDSRKVSISALTTYLQAQGTSNSLVTQYSSPNATAFSVTIDRGNTFLLITPTGAFATGTITLPASPTDGQSVLVTSTQAITTLTVGGNGKTVNGAPTTLAANGSFRMRYDAINSSWYRSA